MLAELFVAASINSLLVGPTGGEIENDIIQLVDRGRLTPFGRTYDIYLDTDGRTPSFLHGGRTWICDPDEVNGPLETRGKENKDAWIRISNFSGKDPLWFNYEGNQLWAPSSDVRTGGFDAWYANNDPEWWDCKLQDPFDRAYFQTRVPTMWIQPNCCPKRVANLEALPFFWADTWLLQEGIGIVSSPNGDPLWPSTYTRDADWILPNFDGTPKTVREIRKDAIDDITESWRCEPSPSSRDAAVIMDFNNATDWESDEFPGQFRIMRITGPIDQISMRFYITYEDLGGALPGQTTCDEGVNRQDYALDTFAQLRDTCPTDLNEDGDTNFDDLLKVLADMGAGKYYGGSGFQAILAVLGGWGPC